MGDTFLYLYYNDDLYNRLIKRAEELELQRFRELVVHKYPNYKQYDWDYWCKMQGWKGIYKKFWQYDMNPELDMEQQELIDKITEKLTQQILDSQLMEDKIAAQIGEAINPKQQKILSQQLKNQRSFTSGLKAEKEVVSAASAHFLFEYKDIQIDETSGMDWFVEMQGDLKMQFPESKNVHWLEVKKDNLSNFHITRTQDRELFKKLFADYTKQEAGSKVYYYISKQSLDDFTKLLIERKFFDTDSYPVYQFTRLDYPVLASEILTLMKNDGVELYYTGEKYEDYTYDPNREENEVVVGVSEKIKSVDLWYGRKK